MKTKLIASALLATSALAAPAFAQHAAPDWSFSIHVPAPYVQQQAPNVVVVPAPGKYVTAQVPAPMPKPVISALPPLPQGNDWQERDHQWRERDNYRNRMLENNQRVSAIVNDRQDAQIDMIVEGVRTGRIGRDQFGFLMEGQKRLRGIEHGYLGDGFWSKEEFDSISRLLDEEERNIRRMASRRGRY
jgi:hypothetical protein